MNKARLPWERLLDEPDRWFVRFCRYLYGGPGRSFLATYRREWRDRDRAGVGSRGPNSIPNTWQRAVVRWRWRERAAAWDAAERERLRNEYEADRQADRLARIRILQAHRERLSAAIERLDPTKASWADLTAALRMFCEQSRLEETGLAPDKGSGKDDWSDLLNPESARAQLAALLDAAGAFRQEHDPRNQTEA